MSQKEETVRKLKRLRSSLTSEESNALLDTIDLDLDLDTDGVSRGRVIGEMIGRRFGGIVGRRVGKRLDRVIDERFDSGTALASVADALADTFKPDGTTDTESSGEANEASEEEAREDEAGEEETGEDGADEGDNGGHEFEADLSEMSTGDLQSLADQLMNELQQRNETEGS